MFDMTIEQIAFALAAVYAQEDATFCPGCQPGYCGQYKARYCDEHSRLP